MNNYIYSDATNCDESKDVAVDVEDVNREDIATDTNDINEYQLSVNISENWRGLVRKSPREHSSDVKKAVNPHMLINIQNGITLNLRRITKYHS